MAHTKGPKVSNFEWTKAADRDEELLSEKIHKDFIELKKEMCTGQYTPGRDLKKRKGTKKNMPPIWQARLSQSYRVTFTFKDGLATFQRMGHHKVFD